MSDPLPPGVRGQVARAKYAATQRLNPFLSHHDHNGSLADIAVADYLDAHNGSIDGFVAPAPAYTERNDVGALPFRVVHWSQYDRREVVQASDFWTERIAEEYAALQRAGFRRAIVRHFAPLDPEPMAEPGWCWNAKCVSLECDGIAHRDKYRFEWEQPHGTVRNHKTGNYEFVVVEHEIEESHPPNR